MVKATYGFKDGARVGGDPQVVGIELEKIRKANGELTAENTVSAAKSKASPIHDRFEWDDKKAGHEHRLWQARQLIRAVVIQTPNQSNVPQYFRVNVEKNQSGRYEPLANVVDDVDLYQSALDGLQSKLSSAARAVEELREAAGRSKKRGQLAIINIVSQSLQAAQDAMKQLSP